VYSSVCLPCSGGTIPLAPTDAAVPATAALYWPGQDVAPHQADDGREAWWDRTSWNVLSVWGRQEPVQPAPRTLGPVVPMETEPIGVEQAPVAASVHTPALTPALMPARHPVPVAERHPGRAPHLPHPVVTHLPTSAAVDPVDPVAAADALDAAPDQPLEWDLWKETDPDEPDERLPGATDSFAFSFPASGRPSRAGRHAKRRRPLPSLRGRLSA
jgi:hypothetical protein